MTTLFHESFESGLWTHDVKVFPVGEDPYMTEIGNIHTPEGWMVWFLHDAGTWDQPEGRNTWMHVDPHRIHSGDGAYQLFSFWRRHDAGLMRQVQVEPGAKLRLTAWAHAWSNHNLPGYGDCCDDGRCSCGVGRQVVAIAAEDIPVPNTDPWNDAVGNSVFTIGIDPNGGTDPFSLDVEWGPAFAVYNGYAEQLEVEATAGVSGTATVFLRNTTLYGFKHNDAYWDDAELVVVDGEEPPPEGRGQPREQYKRTYVLLPPGADQSWALAVVNATWNGHRYTLGGSADDAGIGGLDDRNVMAVNPADWGPGLEEFFARYYPGVKYVSVEADTPERLRQILTGETEDIALSQRDPRWANVDLGEDPGGETIGDAGCLLTSLAMCLRHARHWIYPDQLNTILADAKIPFTNDDHLTNWEAAVGLFSEFDDFAKTNTQRYVATLEGMLNDGWEIVLRMPGGSHFVYLESISADDFLIIIDPWDGQRKVRSADLYAGIRAAHRTSGTPPDPPPPDFTLRGVHDMCGAAWLKDNDLPGWVTVARYVGTDPQQLDLRQYTDANIRVILRLTYSYAQDDGGGGTMPSLDRLAAHEDAVVETMRLNPDAWGFVYGNEPNNKREWPGGFDLTPEYYLASYNRVWERASADARVSPCAIDPYNAGWGDWRVSWYNVLCQIAGAGFLALHAYTHGSDLGLIWHKKEFEDAPLIGVYYDMQVLESQQDIIPSRFWDLPVVVTETNHWVRKDGEIGWDPDAGAWVNEAYKYFASKGVAGACLFRHGYRDWRYGDLPGILQALRDA